MLYVFICKVYFSLELMLWAALTNDPLQLLPLQSGRKDEKNILTIYNSTIGNYFKCFSLTEFYIFG